MYLWRPRCPRGRPKMRSPGSRQSVVPKFRWSFLKRQSAIFETASVPHGYGAGLALVNSPQREINLNGAHMLPVGAAGVLARQSAAGWKSTIPTARYGLRGRDHAAIVESPFGRKCDAPALSGTGPNCNRWSDVAPWKCGPTGPGRTLKTRLEPVAPFCDSAKPRC